MLDEASLARLAEMGIEVYLPRRRGEAPRASAAPASPQDAVRAEAGGAAAPIPAGIVLIACADAAKPADLLADVARALRFAHIDCARCDVPDDAMLEAARALVLFGDAQVRAVGARLSAQRQREIGWIVTGDAAVLAGDARAKRALWSELRRVMRTLGAAKA